MSQHFFHFSSEYDAVVFENNTFLFEYNELKQLKPVLISTDNQNILLNIYPLYNDDIGIVLLPNVIKLEYNKGEYRTTDKNTKLIKLNTNNYLLHVRAVSVINNKTEVLNKSAIINNFKIFLYCGMKSRILVKSEKDEHNFYIDAVLDNAKFYQHTINNNSFLILKAEIKNSNKQYLLVFNLSDFNSFFEDICEIVEVLKNKTIKTLTYLNDIASHALVKEYKISKKGLKALNEYTIYLENRAIITTNSKIIPIAFLESVKAKDYSVARYYLSPILSEKLTNEGFLEFFGNFDYALKCPGPNEFYVTIKNNKASIYEVNLENFKITNFKEIIV